MKRFILCVSLVAFAQVAMAAVPMVRFIRVTDSRTIVVARIGGPEEVVHLTNVAVPAEDESAAREFIQQKLTGTFVYVEDGKVYRSPDALFINRELAYAAYASSSLKMQYFGEANPGPHAKVSLPRVTPVRMTVPVPRRRASPTRSRRLYATLLPRFARWKWIERATFDRARSQRKHPPHPPSAPSPPAEKRGGRRRSTGRDERVVLNSANAD
jgi:hypothetical protein